MSAIECTYHGDRAHGDERNETGERRREEEDMDEKDDGSFSATFVSYCNTT